MHAWQHMHGAYIHSYTDCHIILQSEFIFTMNPHFPILHKVIHSVYCARAHWRLEPANRLLASSPQIVANDRPAGLRLTSSQYVECLNHFSLSRPEFPQQFSLFSNLARCWFVMEIKHWPKTFLSLGIGPVVHLITKVQRISLNSVTTVKNKPCYYYIIIA